MTICVVCKVECVDGSDAKCVGGCGRTVHRSFVKSDGQKQLRSKKTGNVLSVRIRLETATYNPHLRQSQNSDVAAVHRVPSYKKDREPSLIVQFYNRAVRDIWISKYRTIKNLSAQKINKEFPARSLYKMITYPRRTSRSVGTSVTLSPGVVMASSSSGRGNETGYSGSTPTLTSRSNISMFYIHV
ncbi:hypothetical protein J6590_049364 [Homalodisca vitripennis]|nr:hypothetical protein J6590_049364 [Homalodisca vitripennis]